MNMKRIGTLVAAFALTAFAACALTGCKLKQNINNSAATAPTNVFFILPLFRMKYRNFHARQTLSTFSLYVISVHTN